MASLAAIPLSYMIYLSSSFSHFTTSSLSQFGSERDAMEWTFMDVSSIFRTKQVSYSLILYFGICSHLLQTHDIKTLEV